MLKKKTGTYTPRYQNVVATDTGFEAMLHDTGIAYKMKARFDVFIIRLAWDIGCSFEDLADGFGKGLGTMGGDWSGIRDSSDEAYALMFERALNFVDEAARRGR